MPGLLGNTNNMLVQARSVNNNMKHTHTPGDGSEDSTWSGDENRGEDKGNRNEDRIGEGGREAKKRKKPQKKL